MPDVPMPRLSDSMEEGTILKWLKSDGDEIHRGDELAEIETDKATMTYEAGADGVLSIVAPEGATLPIGEVIARIAEPAPASVAGDGAGAAGEPIAGSARGPAPGEPAGSAASGRARGEQPGGSAAVVEPAAGASAATSPAAPASGAPATGAAEAAGSPDGERLKASPVARRMARELGIDLRALHGSGPGGRIVKADVLAAPGKAAPAAPAPAAPPVTALPTEPVTPPPSPPVTPPEIAALTPAPRAPETAKGETTVVELSKVQQVVARRMAEAKATIPDFTLHVEVDMEEALRLRDQLKAIVAEGQSVPSFNDMVVKASALALRQFPRANASYRNGRFEHYSRVNVGVAVAGQDSLIVPTIFDADRKTLGQIAAEGRALAVKVRDGRITPPELSGGTFTVSNLGMYGITDFTAVINPPQAAILTVGAIEPRPVVRSGEVVVRHVMRMSLTCDHRILYGAQAAQFLARIRELLEAPVAMAL